MKNQYNKHVKYQEIIQKSKLQPYLKKGFQSYPIEINQLKDFSIVSQQDHLRIKYKQIFDNFRNANGFDSSKLQLSQKQNLLVGVLMGLGIGDALGSSTEFAHYKKNGYGIFNSKKGFKAIQQAVNQKIIYPKFDKFKKINIWTDDTSMALCLAYNLIINKINFQPNHVRCLYHLWWNSGLANGGLNKSVGLGGNIAISLQEFQQNINSQYVQEGNQSNNGNGSLMRLAPVPIFFNRDLQKAMKVSEKQSLTTHNGLEAKQCCRLLTSIIINLINRSPQQKWKDIIQSTGQSFQSSILEVKYLAQSKKQTDQMFDKKFRDFPLFKQFNQTVEDRNWDWKSLNFDYSPYRLKINPTYIGSYCMDALAMALHIVWTTNSFRECVQKAADMGGDSDTVGAIAGQIAGAIYGFNQQMFELYTEMTDFTQQRYQLFLVSLKLIKQSQNQYKSQLIDNNKVQGKKIPKIHTKQNNNNRKQEQSLEKQNKKYNFCGFEINCDIF